jgi:N-methylhydantoinase B
MEFQLFAPQSMVTARNRNHSEITPWGVLGGKAGATSRFVINPDSNHATELRNTDIVVCKPNDIVRIQGPGAGGYGHPFDRPAEAVVEDVRRGFVSPARARDDYGVVVENGVLDAAASAALRGTRERSPGHFDFNPGRRALESVWTLERYAALNAILAALPVTWRHFVKHHVFAAIGDRPPAAGGGPEDVHRIYRELATQFADLPALDTIARAA